MGWANVTVSITSLTCCVTGGCATASAGADIHTFLSDRCLIHLPALPTATRPREQQAEQHCNCPNNRARIKSTRCEQWGQWFLWGSCCFYWIDYSLGWGGTPRFCGYLVDSIERVNALPLSGQLRNGKSAIYLPWLMRHKQLKLKGLSRY